MLNVDSTLFGKPLCKVLMESVFILDPLALVLAEL